MRTVSWLGHVVLGVTLVCLVGCSGRRATTFAPSPKAQANVMLDLSNQSVARHSVVLVVFVDGQQALRKEMQSVFANRSGRPHGYPETFPLRLSPGPHTIRVAAEGGVASITTDIVVGGGTVYVSAAYWWAPGNRNQKPEPEKITIQVQDEPFGYV